MQGSEAQEPQPNPIIEAEKEDSPSPTSSPSEQTNSPQDNLSESDLQSKSQSPNKNQQPDSIPSLESHPTASGSGISTMLRKMTRREKSPKRGRRTITSPDVRASTSASSAGSAQEPHVSSPSSLSTMTPSSSTHVTPSCSSNSSNNSLTNDSSPEENPPETSTSTTTTSTTTSNSPSRLSISSPPPGSSSSAPPSPSPSPLASSGKPTGRQRSPRRSAIVSFFSKLGGKHPQNEDRYHFQALPSPTANPVGQYFWLGVYDGHGGHEASQYVCEHLHEQFVSCPQYNEEKIGEALKFAFSTVDEQFLEFDNTSGSCAIVAVISLSEGGEAKKIWIGNTGDSRAVLCKNGKATALSNDHKALSPSERARVSKAGGVVYLGRLFGVLAVSRSIGDKELKIRRRGILISEPELTEHEVTEDGLLVLASDGLWDVLSNEDVGQLLMSSRTVSEKTAQLLVERAVERGSADDITALVVVIRNGGGCVIA